MVDRIRRAVLALAWLAVIVAMALGGAGIVAISSHPAGTAARADLTWAGDRALAPSLAAGEASLRSVSGLVDRLALDARGALAALSASDDAAVTTAIDDGGDQILAIRDAAAILRAQLQALPGDRADDAITYGLDGLARRSAMLDALAPTEDLARSWVTLTTGAREASRLIGLLTDHDTTVAAAAADGRAARYEPALAALAGATGMLAEAQSIRDQLANTTDVSTLDSWLSRNTRYDAALAALYTALRDSGGLVNDAVRAAYKEESDARAVLPPDTRGLVVIVADVGRGGLNQAVIAIEQVRGRLSLTLQALEPADGGSS